MQRIYLAVEWLALIASAACIGCGQTASKSPEGNSPAGSAAILEQDPGTGHHHENGPHDGTICDWGGGKYHVELTVDHDLKQVTVYVLGGDAVTPSPITAETLQVAIIDPVIQVELAATPLEGEPAGASSRFVGNHELLSRVQPYRGTISGVVEGKPYAGDFKEESHEH
jgi:hypothetical protein